MIHLQIFTFCSLAKNDALAALLLPISVNHNIHILQGYIDGI